MKPRKQWSLSWIAHTPNGTVYIEYVDGRAIWLAGVKVNQDKPGK